MITNKLKLLLPHVVAVFLFLIISLAYFYPLLKGEKIAKQHDIKMYQGMSKEISDFRDKTGQEALWTNSMFGGMPAYQISVVYKHNIAGFFNKLISLNLEIPAKYLFLSLLGFYILLLAFGLDVWLSFAGALAFGFSSYFFIIEGAGHNSKAHAMAYMAPIIAGFLLSFRGKHLLGSVLVALFLSMQLNTNHPQITYYTFLTAIVLAGVEFLMALRNAELPRFLKAVAGVSIAVVISVGVNFSSLYPTWEYGKYSTRGKSELSAAKNPSDVTSGLDRSYILNDYSYGLAETFDLFIPAFVAAGEHQLDTKSETYKYLKSINYSGTDDFIKSVPLYWGAQTYTAGPVYIGAVVVFLFVLGLFVVRGRIKWWLAGATFLAIFLAWGRNFDFLSNLFIDYFPGYNKFRTVSMILVVAELCMPVLAALALWKMYSNELRSGDKMKSLRNATAIVVGTALFFVIFPGVFLDFGEAYDNYLKTQGWPGTLLEVIRMDRRSILQADSIRSLIFVVLAATTLFVYLKTKMSTKLVSLIFAVLFVADLGFVGKRYFNSSNFAPKHDVVEPFSPSQADLVILKDKDPGYRVVNIGLNTFNDASTSYFHKSIGGYHGAKLKRYQELIEAHIVVELQQVYSVFGKTTTPQSLDSVMARLGVVNMLNTRYVIYNDDVAPLVNAHAFGSAWFVKSAKVVKNADEELAALGKTNLRDTMVVDRKLNEQIKPSTYDSLAQIKLTAYEPNRLVYQSSASAPQLAVFSEIYYDKGWNAYVDGVPAPYFRANYVLRAMDVPAGKHTIEFRFEPKSYLIGERISLASSVVLVLLLLGVVVYEFRKNIQKSPSNPTENA